jgi:hypothetical protein
MALLQLWQVFFATGVMTAGLGVAAECRLMQGAMRQAKSDSLTAHGGKDLPWL